MPTSIAKNLNLCFTKIQQPLSPLHDHNRPFSSTSITPSTLIKNFNSLYDSTLDSTTITPLNDSLSLASEDDSSVNPDVRSAFASHRFFCPAPGMSSSIADSILVQDPSVSTLTSLVAAKQMHKPNNVEGMSSSPMIESTLIQDPSLSTLTKSLAVAKQLHKQDNVVDDRIAIPTFSPDPYVDFRRSMQEMVEARELKDVRANWDDLHELLMCFLVLNPKCTHKFIFGAFADLLVSLMKSFPDEHEIRRNLSHFRSD